MSFRTGSIVSNTPGQQLITEIEAAFDLHDNWDFVEEVITGTAPNRAFRRVWKNRGSGLGANSWGQDFYIVFAYTEIAADAGKIYVYSFEHWDTTTKRFFRPARHSYNLTPNANFSWGDEVNGYPLTDPSLTMVGFQNLNTTGFDYLVKATKDQLFVGAKQGTSDDFFSVGVFESFLTDEPFPLYMRRSAGGLSHHSFYSTSWAYGNTAWSRHPKVTIAQPYNFMGDFVTMGFMIGGVGNDEYDRFHGGILYGRLGLRPPDGVGDGQRKNYGYARGRLYDAVLLAYNGGSTRSGDTITLNADVYVAFAVAVGSCWWVKRDAA